MKKLFSYILSGLLVLNMLPLVSCTQAEETKAGAGDGDNVLCVYNYGDYIDEDLIEEFEEETGIEVRYDTYSTNEEMYPRIAADPSLYDVICPSEYMVSKMIENDLLQEVDWTRLENAGNLGEKYMEILSEYVDPGNRYAIPYFWGTVGILYNTTLMEEAPDSWWDLWDENYSGSILMQDSVRDAFMVAEKALGYSMNETDETVLEECRALLHREFPLVKAYVVDEVRDKMIAGETAMGVAYSGEYLYCQGENEDISFVNPKEGTNVWYDCWVISKGAKHVDAAYLWLDFLLRGDVAYRNFDYVTYPTPNVAAEEYIDEELLMDEALFPTDEYLDRCEIYLFLGDDIENLYYEMWKRVK